jgi:hypothetical protein
VKSRRALIWTALLALATPLLFQASCASIVGVDVEALDDVVKDMCGCPELDALKQAGTCESTLTKRLVAGGPADRADWLEKYDKECTKCPGVLACLREKPACSIDECTITAECCQSAGSIKKVCTGGHCDQPK